MNYAKNRGIRAGVKVLLAALVLLSVFAPPTAAASGKLSICEFGDRGLEAFVEAAGSSVPLDMLVGVWLYEGRDIQNPDGVLLNKIAGILALGEGKSEREQLKIYVESSSVRTDIQKQIARMSDIMHVVSGKVFPLNGDVQYWYEDSWMAYRSFGGERSHEGVDIICDTGTPILSMGDGRVERMGWNNLGGWRVGIRGIDGVYYYYAHLSAYASGLYVGKAVHAGEVIGLAGSTGYGPEGTDDVMIPHLHVGMYVPSNHTAVNPYPFLRYLENIK
ncbi:MAG: M23 family metallopeptidase [Christensenellales bacterium]|jgi:murein DD-endopeptidase MepM/ murein hydrolase activator NlpD